MSVHIAKPEHEIVYQDLCKLIGRHVEKMTGTRYGHAPNWVNTLATKHGWPILLHRKADKVAPAPVHLKRPHAHKAKSIAQVYQEQKSAQAGRDQELYGGIVDDVAELRRAGFVVTREAGKVLVGNRLCTFAEVVELAARERRLRTPLTLAREVRT